MVFSLILALNGFGRRTQGPDSEHEMHDVVLKILSNALLFFVFWAYHEIRDH